MLYLDLLLEILQQMHSALVLDESVKTEMPAFPNQEGHQVVTRQDHMPLIFSAFKGLPYNISRLGGATVMRSSDAFTDAISITS